MSFIEFLDNINESDENPDFIKSQMDHVDFSIQNSIMIKAEYNGRNGHPIPDTHTRWIKISSEQFKAIKNILLQ